jgi:MATE family multidrug resistance protein
MKSIWRLGLIIALTRLIILSIPFIDTVMLGRYGAEQLSIFVIGNQLPQLLMIISMGLLVGINVIVPKEKNDFTAVITSAGIYAIVISIVSIFILLLFNDIYSSDKEIATKDILSAGIPFAIFYYAVASILESCGREKIVLIISSFAAILNPILNYMLLNSDISFLSEAAYSVATATSIIRGLMMFVAMFVLFKVINIKITTHNFFTIKYIRNLFKIGISESVSRGLFAGSIVALSFYIAGVTSVENMAIFGIALSVINTFLVFFLGMVISLTVNLSKLKNEFGLDIKSALIMAIKSIVPIFVAFILMMTICRNFLAYLYVDDNQLLYASVVSIIPYCIAVIVLDASASSMVSMLRVYGDEKVPPLIKMMTFICLGIPVALLCLDDYSIVGVLTGFIIGNSLAVILLAIRFQLFTSKLCDKRCNMSY